MGNKGKGFAKGFQDLDVKRLHSHLFLDFAIEEKSEHEDVDDDSTDSEDGSNGESDQCNDVQEKLDDEDDQQDDPDDLVDSGLFSIVNLLSTPADDETEDDADDSGSDSFPISDDACDACECPADDRHDSNSVDESAEDVDLSRNGSAANG